MFENNFPYTDFHELNLDWIITKLKKFENDFYVNLSKTITENVNKLLPSVIYNEEKRQITLEVLNSSDSCAHVVEGKKLIIGGEEKCQN